MDVAGDPPALADSFGQAREFVFEQDDVSDALGRGFGLLGARLGQFGLLFVSGLLVARLLGPAGRGQYAVVLSLALLMFILGNLSLDLAAGRLLAHGEAAFQQLTEARFRILYWPITHHALNKLTS